MVVAFLLVGLAIAAPLSAKPIGDAKVAYTADMTLEGDGLVMTGETRHTPGRDGRPGLDRLDLMVQGMRQTIIIRPDHKVAWVILPDQGGYASYSLDNARELVGVMDDERVTLTPLGQETVAGLPATHYRFEGADGRGTPIAGEVWLTADDIVVRMTGQSVEQGRTRNVVMQLDNVRIGPVPDAAFEVPPGLRLLQ
jgi:hypothetical protein